MPKLIALNSHHNRSLANSFEDYFHKRRAQVLRRMETMFDQRPFSLHLPQKQITLPTARSTLNDKYNITIDCSDYDVNSLKTEILIKSGMLYVSGREENKKDMEDYSIKEFKKTYKLPDNALSENVTSFFIGKDLVIEVPLRNNLSNETKKINYSCILPKNINPSDVQVTYKDTELIIKAETSQELFYQSYTCPENTDLKGLKCELVGNQLNVTIPYTNHRQIPVKYIN